MRRELLVLAASTMLNPLMSAAGQSGFGPSNPFYAESSLPFQAPPFDKIKDKDYTAGHRGRNGAATRRSAGDRRESGAGDVRQHLRAPGEERASSRPHRAGLWRRHGREHQSVPAGSEERARTEAHRAPGCHLSRTPSSLRGSPPSMPSANERPQSRAEAPGRGHLRSVRACRSELVAARQGAAQEDEFGGVDPLRCVRQ